ncbi:MAG: hypothetical protein QXY70_03700 [Nanopusillaceae archaeon]
MSSYFNLIFLDLQRKNRVIDLEELDNLYNSRECMLRCLYSIEVLYEGLEIPYKEFEEMYKNKKNSEIRKILDKKIKKYNKSIDIKEWAEDLVVLTHAKRLKMKRVKYIESPMYTDVDSIIDYLIEISHEFGDRR